MQNVRVSGWARVWTIVNPALNRYLRRGAWYPIEDDGPAARVVLRVDRRRIAVSRRLVEIREEPPEKFTIVHRAVSDPNPVRGSGHDLGMSYAVCPSCRRREPIHGHPDSMTCAGCNHHGELAWWETG